MFDQIENKLNYVNEFTTPRMKLENLVILIQKNSN